MSETEGLRASDAEREQAAAEIREHYSQGRLDDAELAERLEQAYAARTRGQLQALRSDLPPLPALRSDQRAEHVAQRAELTRQLLQQTGGALVPFLIATAIWLLAGADGKFWPGWLLLLALIPLLRNGWRLYGPAPELDRVAQHLDRDNRRRERRRERHESRRSR
jgi:hypothetical protein